MRRRCVRCELVHRIGGACPPPVPPVRGLDRLAAAWWQQLERDMAEARAVDAAGLRDMAA